MSRGVEEEGFAAFFAVAEPRLRRALVARLGPDRGHEAAAEALAWGFEHWSEVAVMTNGVGYLYRVGTSRTRPRKPVEAARLASVAVRSDRADAETVVGPVVDAGPPDDPGLDPELWAAMMALSDNQRVAVVLVHAYDWPMQEVADLLNVSVTTVGTHLRRGLDHLRRRLGDPTNTMTEAEADDA